MSHRVDVIARKPLTLGGRTYGPGEHVFMAEGRLRQYELIQKRTGQAIVERARVDGVRPAAAVELTAVQIDASAEPAAPTREAAVVHGEPRRRTYRNRQIQSGD